MAAEETSLRPETHALDALIKATIQRAKENTDVTSPDTMLFMGNWHQAIPALVIQDPVLEPVDKLVWMVIMLQARETGGRTAFPSYDRLASKTNVSSTSTISRAIAILRLTRWLTLCAKVRGKCGQFKGNVYVLHDEPLPFVDALYLDAQYMQFLEQSVKHHHARVRAVAQGVLGSLDEGIRSGQDISQSKSSLEQRAQAVNIRSNTSNNQDSARRHFAFSANVLNQLQNTRPSKNPPKKNQNQNSKTVEKTHYSSGCSHNKLTTTTTPTQNNVNNESAFSENSEALIYPRRLSDNQKVLADRYLAMIDPQEQQFVLDELQGRLESEQKGMNPVYDELRFLHSLCKAVQQGEFVPNLGIKVAEARVARQQPLLPPEAAQEKELSEEEKQRAREFGFQQLAKLRQSFDIEKDK